MAAYMVIRDETGQKWLLQQNDPLWRYLTPLREAGYKYEDLILPSEVALHLTANTPDYDAIDFDSDPEEVGQHVLVEDIRSILNGT